MEQIFNYHWRLSDGYPANGIEKHGLKVFSTFACGGGSTMGYKLAGYDVIGANDIDEKMADIYKANHQPKIFLKCPIGDMLAGDLPDELYHLDILDGSPPCSTFSMAGSREKAWKKDKQFREGQSKQVLSDLFFDWISLVDRLKPKVAIAENVRGMLFGNAKAYTGAVLDRLYEIGYDTQLFLLNASTMGVPQRRERVFFVARRRDLGMGKLSLQFNNNIIPYKEISQHVHNELGDELSDAFKRWWSITSPGHSFSQKHYKGSFFNSYRVHPSLPLNTITASGGVQSLIIHIPTRYQMRCFVWRARSLWIIISLTRIRSMLSGCRYRRL